MTLSDNKTLRLLTLCGLYVAQGIPFGFITVTFAAWLARDEFGLSEKEIGPMIAAATLPWAFKFCWGPLIDRFPSQRFGRRRPWIIFSQGMAILIFTSFLFLSDIPSMIQTSPPEGAGAWQWLFRLVPGPLAALVLLANVFVSMQDVAVDALAVDLLPPEERGKANGLMYGSSYLGTAIGGAGLGLLVATFGIKAGFAGQAVLMTMIMCLPVLFRERPEGTVPLTSHLPEGVIPDLGELPELPPELTTDEKTSESATEKSESVFLNLLRAFSLRSTLIGAFLAVGVKVGIGILTVVFVNYLIKEGGWTQEEYSRVNGGYTVLLGLFGAASGGFLADRFGAKFIIVITSITLGGLWILYGASPVLIQSKGAVIVMLLAQELLFAVMSVALFSLFMSVSWPKVAATQFTTYMALMNLSTTTGNHLAGTLTESLSLFQILQVAGAIQIVLVLPVLAIDVGQTARVLGHATEPSATSD